ncbi:AraC family transcriptional regulator [Ruficoccus amylovorans]|uniref:AraC family transcriptional regulator n=1 Tax=Ruficoccus amylovorans TaxID=1804625 RepID=A0A842HF92_9BACT|nr:AraC family transcriptional regulator [Ruficoccus amylovorans]MBC2595092.1 AraC family transcriptional regulator [Ruficoccus amylovorans]
MPARLDTFSRYLPPDPQSTRWGWRLIDAGRQQVPAGGDYPLAGHPLAYFFDKNGRRTLPEFQLVMITAGSGHFQSRSCPERTVGAGDTLLLFPGEWHRYGPSPRTGWTEYWLGFEGEEAARIMKTFFSRSQPVQPGAYTAEAIRIFDQLMDWLRHPRPGGEQVTASFIPQLLALLRAGSAGTGTHRGREEELVMAVRARLMADPAERADLPALAAELGVSYSLLRGLFRRHTGHSPRQFENLIRLNRSRDLLAAGESVTATAANLGYASVHYFSRAFKRQFGQAPQQWRERRGMVS